MKVLLHSSTKQNCIFKGKTEGIEQEEGNRTEGRVKLCFTTTEEEPNSSDALELHDAVSQMTQNIKLLHFC